MITATIFGGCDHFLAFIFFNLTKLLFAIILYKVNLLDGER